MLDTGKEEYGLKLLMSRITTENSIPDDQLPPGVCSAKEWVESIAFDIPGLDQFQPGAMSRRQLMESTLFGTCDNLAMAIEAAMRLHSREKALDIIKKNGFEKRNMGRALISSLERVGIEAGWELLVPALVSQLRRVSAYDCGLLLDILQGLWSITELGPYFPELSAAAVPRLLEMDITKASYSDKRTFPEVAAGLLSFFTQHQLVDASRALVDGVLGDKKKYSVTVFVFDMICAFYEHCQGRHVFHHQPGHEPDVIYPGLKRLINAFLGGLKKTNTQVIEIEGSFT